ncbi:single-stranded DNA-binding protein [Candidatus Phytoplasma australasiaticum]
MAWDKQAESLTRYITKGSLLAIEGRVRTEIYEDHNNQQKTTFDTKILCTNIKFLESKEYSDYKKNKQKSEYSNHLDVEQTSHNRDIKKNNQSFSDIKEDEDESLF